MDSINPATGEHLAHYDEHDDGQVDTILTAVHDAQRDWAPRPQHERCEVLRHVAAVLRARREDLAALVTSEMGKPIAQARAEVDKCAWACEHYADHLPAYLADEVIGTQAAVSRVQNLPLGVVFAIMPWNFPLWQVIRAAAPTVGGGNALVLKHAANVTGCAYAVEDVWREAGAHDLLRVVVASADTSAGIIADDRIAGVTLTGSDRAGSAVAALAGEHLKPSVLELGGSDPFVVLADADVEAAASTAATARFQNTGQSCIAAKRFVVERDVAPAFIEAFVSATAALEIGDPTGDVDLGPMARPDLRTELDEQVRQSIDAGGRVVHRGAAPDGDTWHPTTVVDVTDVPAARLRTEEAFGPVAAILRVADVDEAVAVANDSPYGLSSSIWTADLDRAAQLSRRIHAGACFVNAMTQSDPRVPFGGVGRSGYGRELARQGALAFQNQQTLWMQSAG